MTDIFSFAINSLSLKLNKNSYYSYSMNSSVHQIFNNLIVLLIIFVNLFQLRVRF